MTKYTLVVLERERAAFLERLQGLGMVDVTTSGWSPSAEDRVLMDEIEKRSEAVAFLETVKSDANSRNPEVQGASRGGSNGEAVASDGTTYDDFVAAREKVAELASELASERKLASELAPLGDFDPQKLRALTENGVSLETLGLENWGAAPERNARQVERHAAELETQLADNQQVIASAAANVRAIEQETEALKDRLQLDKAQKSGQKAVDGRLVVMEAWARSSQTAEVEKALHDTLYIKARPTPDDATPVELRNKKWSAPFEFIGNLYAKPRYGRMDLTRWFAPFFMLFFGMCMADFGYGFLIFAAGLAVTLSAREEGVKTIGKLSMMCGGTAVAVGFVMGSAFGVSVAEWAIFAPVKRFFVGSDKMFYIAIGIGVFQVLFAMTLNIVTTARAFGAVHALASVGWVVVLVACVVRFALGASGVWFPVTAGLGGALMLLFDSPGKNPLASVASGLYTTFNRVTGLLSDALSYIRLFAIGLSGGVLAMVFNRIATEVSPDIPVVGQLVTLVLLLFGHLLNLFMSTISAIVHPLRLTFVEFFNNAGFEASDREFEPLKKQLKNDKL